MPSNSFAVIRTPNVWLEPAINVQMNTPPKPPTKNIFLPNASVKNPANTEDAIIPENKPKLHIVLFKILIKQTILNLFSIKESFVYIV